MFSHDTTLRGLFKLFPVTQTNKTDGRPGTETVVRHRNTFKGAVTSNETDLKVVRFFETNLLQFFAYTKMSAVCKFVCRIDYLHAAPITFHNNSERYMIQDTCCVVFRASSKGVGS
jgi:hypothetical protein